MTEPDDDILQDAYGVELRRRLQQVGLRVTAPRVSVLSVLLRHPGHHTVGEVAELARQRLGTLSTQATYNVLDALSRAGLAQRIELPGEAARFEARTGDNHHHMVCRRCGRVLDVDCEVDVVPCLEPSDPLGFAIDKAEITFWGTCPACQASQGGRSELAGGNPWGDGRRDGGRGPLGPLG